MPQDVFTQTQKGKFTLEKVTKHAETLDLDEAANSISNAKTSPNYVTLKLVLCSLETILVTQKEILRKLEELGK